MKTNINLKYTVPFMFLTILCGTSHEFVHHFVGAAICGGFGYKTFNYFELYPGCEEASQFWLLATYAGPIFTFILMWIGLYQIRQTSQKKKQLGFALIFANFPLNRILFALLGGNDEQYASSILFGSDNPIAFWLTNICIWLFTFPPLYYCFISIKSSMRIRWFISYLLLPLLFVIFFAGFFLEDWLLLKKQFMADTVIGIPYLILLVEAISIAGYYFTRKYLYEKALVQLK